MMTSIIILIIYYYFYCTIYTYVNYTITLYYYYIHIILRLLYYYNYYNYCNIAYYCFCTRDARKCALSKRRKTITTIYVQYLPATTILLVLYVHVGALYNNIRNKKKTAWHENNILAYAIFYVRVRHAAPAHDLFGFYFLFSFFFVPRFLSF